MNIRHTAPGILVSAFLLAGLAAQEDVPPTPPNGAPPEHRPPPVQEPPQLQTGAPNEWFDRTRLFLGDFLDQELVSGKFKFKNPSGKKQIWTNLTGSCQCVRAVINVGDRTYELSKKPVANSLHRLDKQDGRVVRKRVTQIEVDPDDSGEVEVHMEMGGLQGLKDATLAITTSDPDLKQCTLTWQARGVKLFTISPNDVFLNNMKWDDERKFEFTVASSVNPDFKLLDHEELPDYVKVSKEQIQLPDGKKAWKVWGTFGPKADPKAGGAAIKFNTDWKDKEVRLTVIATVTPPVTIMPGTFLSFGKIRKGEGAERQITFTPDENFDLQLLGAEFPNLTFDEKYITAVAEKQGKSLVVTIKISPEVNSGYLVRGGVVLKLNHPSLESKKFNFNGILR